MRFAKYSADDLREVTRPRGDRFVIQERLQIIGERIGGCVAQVAGLLQALQRDEFEVGISVGIEYSRRDRVLFEHLQDGVHRRGRLKRRPARPAMFTASERSCSRC